VEAVKERGEDERAEADERDDTNEGRRIWPSSNGMGDGRGL
jgi:hypothetical protein